MALLAFASCAPNSLEPGGLTVTHIANGAYARATEVTARAALDEAGYERMWQSMIGVGEAPPVDFTTQAVVFIFGGQRNTGGHELVVHGASVEGEDLVLDAEVKSPGRGSMVTQALTTPYAVIAVNRRDFRSVRWERDGGIRVKTPVE